MESRRRFLHTAGAATVFQLVRGRAALQSAAANDQIGLAFIGSGIRGTQLLGEFLNIPGVRPVVVCDLYDGYLERAREQTGGKAETTKDYRVALARKDVDAVVIATPDHLHKRMVLEALDAGKPVYIEKPLTWSLDEGAAIIDAVKRTGLLVQVGSQGKTSRLTAKAREIVASGELGTVNMVRMSNHRNSAQGAWVYPIPPDASPATIAWEQFLGDRPKRAFDPAVFFRWRCWWEFSGGVATDLFVHLLTWLHAVMNVQAPASVVSQGGLWRWKDGRDVPDVMNSLFEYPQGFIADLYVNLANGWPDAPTIAILGTEGSLVERRGKLIVYPESLLPDVQTYGTLGWPRRLRKAYFEERNHTAEGRPRTGWPEPKKPKEVLIEEGPSHYEYFILSLRDRSPSRESAEEGHYAAGAAHLANMAYQRGRRMRWDLRTGAVREA